MKKSSSTRLRAGAALASTAAAVVFAFGSTSFAAESNGQGAEHRNERAAAAGSGGGGTSPESRPTQTTSAGASAGESQHPSGRDRTVEPGGSGTQGRSPSDPDGTSNGGADKPGGSGGVFLGDQDGNNGCGNDQDFEDDNRGLCLGPQKRRAKTPPAPTPPGQNEEEIENEVVRPVDGDEGGRPVGGVRTDGTLAGGGSVAPAAVLGSQLQTPAVEARVLGVAIERAPAASAAIAPAAGGARPTSVLGVSFDRGSPLARTGFGLTMAALVGLLLILVGAALKQAERREHPPLA